MVAENGTSARTTAEMMAYVGRLAHGEGFVRGLTNAQWTALRYFYRANRYSRTVSAFATYHATTRGTASQTTKSLVDKGYLERTRSESDGRSIRFDLTDEGRAVMRDDPFQVLVDAIGELPPGMQTNLLVAVERITQEMSCGGENRSFGSCSLCAHLDRCVFHEDEEADYFCRHENEPVAATELDEICVNFEPGAGFAAKRKPAPRA